MATEMVRKNARRARCGAVYCFSKLLLASLVTCGCAGYSALGGPGKLVNPSLMSATANPRELVTLNTLCVSALVPSRDAKISPETLSSLDHELARALQASSGLEIKSLATQKIGKSGSQRPSNAKGCDAVMNTDLHQYVERSGGAYGSNSPALVDMAMQIRRVSDSRVLWEGTYVYRDAALSENLLRLPQRLETDNGLSWRRADELAREAFEATAHDISKRREEAFGGRQLRD